MNEKYNFLMSLYNEGWLIPLYGHQYKLLTFITGSSFVYRILNENIYIKYDQDYNKITFLIARNFNSTLKFNSIFERIPVDEVLRRLDELSLKKILLFNLDLLD